jgi:hypothetical protein
MNKQLKFKVEPILLSDGSRVYDVYGYDESIAVEINCIDKRQAENLAEMLSDCLSYKIKEAS